MKRILALGNPGARYRDTRHNVGWWLADRLCRAWDLPAFRTEERSARTRGRPPEADVPVEVVKPLTYVNRSGAVVAPWLREPDFRVGRDLLVLVDDVWLPPGTLRLRARGSAGGHNGLASVEAAVGTEAYGRLRVGVGRPEDERVDLAEWVLSSVPAAEEEAVLEALDRAVRACGCWLEHGIEEAMNRFNR